MTRARIIAVLFPILFAAAVAGATAPPAVAPRAETPPEEMSFRQPSASPPDEDLFVNQPLPDIRITTTTGDATRLSQLWHSKPLVMTLVFARCGGICYPFLESLKGAANAVHGGGTDYRILVLSFDPRDTLDDMRSAAEGLGLPVERNLTKTGWIFGVAAPADLRRLAKAIGFWFRWDTGRGQYDHPSLLVAVDRGRIVRMLAGAGVPPVRFSEVVDELRGKFVPAYPLPGRNVTFHCFQYEPGGGVRLSWGFLLMILPGTLAIVTTVCVFTVSRTEG